jgi:hypothetical protein
MACLWFIICYGFFCWIFRLFCFSYPINQIDIIWLKIWFCVLGLLEVVCLKNQLSVGKDGNVFKAVDLNDWRKSLNGFERTANSNWFSLAYIYHQDLHCKTMPWSWGPHQQVKEHLNIYSVNLQNVMCFFQKMNNVGYII